MDKFEALKKYSELLSLGIITQEEFDKKKAVILDLASDADLEMSAAPVVQAASKASDLTTVESEAEPVVEIVESASADSTAADADAAPEEDLEAGTVTLESTESESAASVAKPAAASGIDDLKKSASKLPKPALIGIAAVAVIVVIAGFYALFGGRITQDQLVGIWTGSWYYEGAFIQEGISFEADGTFTELNYRDGTVSSVRYGTYEIKGSKVVCHDKVTNTSTDYKHKRGKLVNNGHELTKS